MSKQDSLKIISDECNRLWQNKETTKSYIPDDDAVAFYYSMNLSTQMYQKMRTFLLKFNTILPTRNEIDRKK